METIIALIIVGGIGYVAYRHFFLKETTAEAVKETVQEVKEAAVKVEQAAAPVVEEVVKKVRKTRTKKAK